MELVEKLGNIKAYAEKNAENNYTVYLVNGAKMIIFAGLMEQDSSAF